MKKVCKICNKEKFKIKIGKRNTGSIFVDEVNREWNGKCCPECNLLRVQMNMRKIRTIKLVGK